MPGTEEVDKYLTISIDTEPDCSDTWALSDPLTFTGMDVGIGERLHPLFLKYGVRPTYLINSIVLEHEPSVDVLRNLDGSYELAPHMHCEFIEPEKLYDDYAGIQMKGNQCFLDPGIEFQKLENITNLFTFRFGRRPVSYRVGRFSAGANTIRSLRSLGYKVDTSVTPHINWNDKTRERPVDYRAAPEQSYFVSDESIIQPDERSTLLEVPVSLIPSEAWRANSWAMASSEGSIVAEAVLLDVR